MSGTDRSFKSSLFDDSNAWAIKSNCSHWLRLGNPFLSRSGEDFFRREDLSSFVFITCVLDQAIGGGPRYVQLALCCRRLPRLAGEHAPDKLQPCRTIKTIFHLFCPSIPWRSCTLLRHSVPLDVVLV